MQSRDFSGQVYTTVVLGDAFSYRALTRRELRNAQARADGNSTVFEDAICEAAVLKVPEEFPGWDDCLAGVPMALAREILDTSGFLNKRSMAKIDDEISEWISTAEARADSLICFCFPGCKLEELDDMDPRTWQKYAAMSQLIIQGVYGIDPSNFMDVEGQAINPQQPQAVTKRLPTHPPGGFHTPPAPMPQPRQQPRGHGATNKQSEIEQEGVFSFTS